jgi:hypothetical protein
MLLVEKCESVFTRCARCTIATHKKTLTLQGVVYNIFSISCIFFAQNSHLYAKERIVYCYTSLLLNEMVQGTTSAARSALKERVRQNVLWIECTRNMLLHFYFGFINSLIL